MLKSLKQTIIHVLIALCIVAFIYLVVIISIPIMMNYVDIIKEYWS